MCLTVKQKFAKLRSAQPVAGILSLLTQQKWIPVIYRENRGDRRSLISVTYMHCPKHVEHCTYSCYAADLYIFSMMRNVSESRRKRKKKLVVRKRKT